MFIILAKKKKEKNPFFVLNLIHKNCAIWKSKFKYIGKKIQFKRFQYCGLIWIEHPILDYLKGGYGKDRVRLFSRVDSKKTRDNGHKM